ncbi:FKBP-type peptidyl-prolyl cis-trans isomerase [Nocardioides sp. C4-1]|uniref:FKBP-type peptidyl-prolyl cis-trans isomerase n=1 Tax=Nocardioides sp. C4-1 TaxID=3151851 RepID=UPI00326355F9
MSLIQLTRRVGLVAAAASLTVVLAACGDDEDTEATDPSSDTPAETSDSSADGPTPVAPWAPIIETDDADSVTGLDFTDTPEPGTELEVATVTEGDGPEVEVGQTLSVNYFGSVYQGEQPFDESYSRGTPVEFPIGVGQLIPGWDQGIPGVKVGSRIIMSIPSDLGYGDAGSPPTIPGGATLFFVIDVLDAS